MTGLNLTRDGHTLVAHVDRGDANSFSGEMIDALADAVEAAAREPELRFVRVSASGPVFCTGRDREGATPDEIRAEAGRIVRLNELLRSTRLIVVCEVGGDAAGFGVGLAAGADVTVASDAARFWFPELEHGLAPSIVLSWLVQLVPPKRAFELIASGRRFGAAEALAHGIVTEVAPAAKVTSRADAWIELLASKNPDSLADVKQFLSRCRELDEPAAARASVDALALGSLRLQALARGA